MKSFKIALTGPPGIGKTTLLKALCDSLESASFAGFYTDEVRDASGRRFGFDVVKFNGERYPLARVGGSGRLRVGQYSVDVAGFEKFALEELKNAQVVVIDEVGKMECLSSAFLESVDRLISMGDVWRLPTIRFPAQAVNRARDAQCSICRERNEEMIRFSSVSLPKSGFALAEKISELCGPEVQNGLDGQGRPTWTMDRSWSNEDFACPSCVKLVWSIDFLSYELSELRSHLRSLLGAASENDQKCAVEDSSHVEVGGIGKGDREGNTVVERAVSLKSSGVEDSEEFGTSTGRFPREISRASGEEGFVSLNIVGISDWFSLSCRICGEEGESVVGLLRHFQEQKHEETPFQCHWCLGNFYSAKDFTYHVLFEELSLEKQNRFRCALCDLDCSNPRKLDRHATSEKHDSFRCEACDQCFPSLRDFVHHRREDHRGEVRQVSLVEFRCIFCRHEAACASDIEAHCWEEHEEKEVYSCPRCNRKFKRLANLRAHLAQLEFDPNRWCEDCAEFFATKREAETHKSRVHSSGGPFVCDKCGKTYDSMSALRVHEYYHRHSGVCPHCGKFFKQYLPAHIAAIHDRIRKYRCDRCDMAFLHHRQLDDHLAKVHDVNAHKFQFKCDVCDKVCSAVGRLRSHKFNRHGVRDPKLKIHECQRCSREFTDRRKLVSHVKGHDTASKKRRTSQARPDKCHVCEALFSSSEELKNHLTDVHGKSLKKIIVGGAKRAGN